MKSTIGRLRDYKEIPMNWVVKIVCPKEVIAKELHQVVRKFKKSETVSGPLEKGDVAFLKLESKESGISKYNKPMVPVTIGGGLFDAELEEFCIGKCVGETFSCEIAIGSVNVTPLKATRTSYPEPTDELVASYASTVDEYEGIATVAAFTKAVEEKYCKEARMSAVYEKQEELIDEVLTTSEWEFSEEDLQMFADEYMDGVKEELEGEGKTFETLTQEDFIKYFGVSNREEFMHELNIANERFIACILWSAKEYGKEPDMYAEDCMNFEFLENYIREHIIYEEA